MKKEPVGCENCTKCFAGCKTAFPDKFIEGGAETCEGFDEETNPQTVYENIQREMGLIRDNLAADGIYQ